MEEYILVVDDSPTVRAAAEFALTERGFQVKTAVHGLDGLTQLQNIHLGGDKTSMIISDINMPEMDGISFVRTVKKTPFKEIPVLFLTTESQSSLKEEGKKAGAIGWLIKPFSPDQLVKVIRKFVKSAHDSPLIDKESSNSLLSILAKEMKEILPKAKETLEKIKAAPDNTKLLDSLVQIIHYIRSSAHFLGSPKISRFQYFLEKHLRESVKAKELPLTNGQGEIIIASLEVSQSLLNTTLANGETTGIIKEMDKLQERMDGLFSAI